MVDEIYPIPPIPSGLREAIWNEKIVIFIDAGASRIIGCPGWKELADYLVNVAFEQKDRFLGKKTGEV